MNIFILIIIILAGFLGVARTEPQMSDDCVSIDGEGCVVVEEVWADGIWVAVQVGDVAGVIVPADVAPVFVLAGSYFMPSYDVLELAEAALAIEQPGFDNHHRQYVGFQDDAPKIFINGFCDSGEIDWYSEPIQVMDGGDCYFQAIYNIQTGVIEMFSVNGEA